MDSVADDEIVQLNTLEEHDRMAHPMHIHDVPFQSLEREVAAETTEEWETIRDEGWKDSVFIGPGERVKLLMKFKLPSEA